MGTYKQKMKNQVDGRILILALKLMGLFVILFTHCSTSEGSKDDNNGGNRKKGNPDPGSGNKLPVEKIVMDEEDIGKITMEPYDNEIAYGNMLNDNASESIYETLKNEDAIAELF